MKVAGYLRSSARDERLRVEAFCRSSNYQVVWVAGKTRQSQLAKLIKSRAVKGVVVRELADAAPSSIKFLALIRMLSAYDCRLIVTQGPSLDGLSDDAIIRLADIVAHVRTSMFAARSRRNAEKAAANPKPAKRKDVYGVKNGEQIARLLTMPKPLSIRRIAMVAGVAPGTVMTVKRLISLGHKPVAVDLMGIEGLDG